jgi:hypothetical protein
VTEGWQSRLGPDGLSLYMLRGAPPTIWSHDLETGQEEELVTVEGYDAVDFGWGVVPDGRVVFHSQFSGDMELWLGEATTGQ